jgi:hypothetical protein
VSRWRVRIPGAGVKVNIHPLVAATEVPAGETRPAQSAETVVLAFVGAAPTVRIDWTPRAEGAQGLQALVAVQSVQRVWIDEGVVRTRTKLAYEITRAPVDRLQFEVPVDQKVVNVFDANVRQWSVKTAGDVQTITIELFQPVRGTQPVLVELEQFASEAGRRELKAPVVRAVDVSRQQGILAVALAEGLRSEPLRRAGLSQMDIAEVQAATGEKAPAGDWTLGYRFASVPFELLLRVEAIEPSITADALLKARLEPESLKLAFQAVYTIEKAGVFRLELEVPPGFEVRNPRGQAVAGAAPVVVEGHHVEGAANDKLTINLGK